MSVRSLASVLMAAVRTSLVLTAACAMRASSHLQTVKVVAVSPDSLFHQKNSCFSSLQSHHIFYFSLTDIDECEDVRLCAYGRCINTDGSFKCQCYPGYQRTQEGSHCEGFNKHYQSINSNTYV